MLVRELGLADYREVFARMREFTDARQAETADELWLVEHPPVFTLGTNAKLAHVLDPGAIPVVRTDRGGQVTYHAPGQLVVYLLMDLRRRGLGIRPLVTALEQAVVRLAADFGIVAHSRPDAPGVYVGNAKLAALGLRVRRGCSYHGLALNVSMDLAPFARIDPCGFPGLAVTELAALGGPGTVAEAARRLLPHLAATLGLRADELVRERAA